MTETFSSLGELRSITNKNLSTMNTFLIVHGIVLTILVNKLCAPNPHKYMSALVNVVGFTWITLLIIYKS